MPSARLWAAILADGEDPWAHHALGCVYLFSRRFDDSLAEFEMALRLNPNFSLAQGYYGLALSYCGRWEEADVVARRALRLSPRDPFSAVYYGIAAYALFSGRNYDEVIRLLREGIRQRNDFVGAHRVLTAAAGMAGQANIARVALQEASPRTIQYFACLDCEPNADQGRSRPGALFGRLPSRGLGLASAQMLIRPNARVGSRAAVGQGAPRVRSISNARRLVAPQQTAASCQQRSLGTRR